MKHTKTQIESLHRRFVKVFMKPDSGIQAVGIGLNSSKKDFALIIYTDNPQDIPTVFEDVQVIVKKSQKVRPL